jgi:hypothetical protein
LMLAQGLSEVSKCTAQTGFGKRIEQVNHKRFVWKGEGGSICARAFD